MGRLLLLGIIFGFIAMMFSGCYGRTYCSTGCNSRYISAPVWYGHYYDSSCGYNSCGCY